MNACLKTLARGTLTLLCAGLWAGSVLAQGVAAPTLPASAPEASLIDALYLAPAVSTTEGARTRARSGAAASSVASRPAGPGRVQFNLLALPAGSNPATWLAAPDKAQLDTLAQAMRSDELAGLSFRVEVLLPGAPTAPTAAAQALARKRADAVVAYLVQEQGILAERLLPGVVVLPAQPASAAGLATPAAERQTVQVTALLN